VWPAQNSAEGTTGSTPPSMSSTTLSNQAWHASDAERKGKLTVELEVRPQPLPINHAMTVRGAARCGAGQSAQSAVHCRRKGVAGAPKLLSSARVLSRTTGSSSTTRFASSLTPCATHCEESCELGAKKQQNGLLTKPAYQLGCHADIQLHGREGPAPQAVIADPQSLREMDASVGGDEWPPI